MEMNQHELILTLCAVKKWLWWCCTNNFLCSMQHRKANTQHGTWFTLHRHSFYLTGLHFLNKATGYNHANGYASHIWRLSQARIKWEGCDRKGIWHKNGDEGGGSLISTHAVAPSRIVDVSASDISPCTIKPEQDFFWHRLTCVVPKRQ